MHISCGEVKSAHADVFLRRNAVDVTLILFVL